MDIFFDSSYKTFFLTISGEASDYKVDGAYVYSGNIDVALTMNVANRQVGLQLKADSAVPLRRRLFGSGPLLGDIMVAGKQSGSCHVENAFGTNKPSIKVSTKSPDCNLDAYPINERDAICPLAVYGLSDFEIVLEDHSLRRREGRMTLKENIFKRRKYSGFCRSQRLLYDPIGENLIAIALMVAVYQLIVKIYYMSPRP